MDRAALELGSVFLHLKAEINWYQLFNHINKSLDVTSLAQRKTGTLK